MSNASAPQPISYAKILEIYGSLKKPNGPKPAGPQADPGPDAVDAVEISDEARRIDEVDDIPWDKVSPERLLKLIDQIFKKFDLNGDGKVSWREAKHQGVERDTFAHYDVDGDGEVALRKEFAPVMLLDLRFAGRITERQYAGAMKILQGPWGPFKYLAHLFHRIDMDDDYNVSWKEAEHFGVDKELFDEYDLNKDGKVSYLEEFLPVEADRFHKMGILTDEEYRHVMARIKNAQEHGYDPVFDEPLRRDKSVLRRGEDEPKERPLREHRIRVRERVEQWLRPRVLPRGDAAAQLLRRERAEGR